jgi:hypothetical protein
MLPLEAQAFFMPNIYLKLDPYQLHFIIEL